MDSTTDTTTDNGEARVIGSIRPVSAVEAQGLTLADVINANAVALHQLRMDLHRMGLKVPTTAPVLLGAEMPTVNPT